MLAFLQLANGLPLISPNDLDSFVNSLLNSGFTLLQISNRRKSLQIEPWGGPSSPQSGGEASCSPSMVCLLSEIVDRVGVLGICLTPLEPQEWHRSAGDQRSAAVSEKRSVGFLLCLFHEADQALPPGSPSSLCGRFSHDM